MQKTFVSATIICVLGLAGCGSSPPVVRGLVTYNGTPLTSGEVHFLSAEATSPPRSGIIRADGRYEIVNAPLGPVKVAVTSLKISGELHKPAVPGTKIPIKKAVPVTSAIPKRYNSFVTSALQFTVTGGSQTFDIPLNDQ